VRDGAPVPSPTRLDSASTDSLCREPITTKHAGNATCLTVAFMRQDGSFGLHPVPVPEEARAAHRLGRAT